MSTKIKIAQLQDGLHTKNLGRKILFSREVDSTNDWSKRLAMYGSQEGTVAIAETQTKGRGRSGRKWISPVGGLWFSLILKPELHPSEAVKLTFVAGLAVVKVLSEEFNLKAETKWPNDVLVNGRKICGILTEMNTTGETINFVVIGIGLNANFDSGEAFPANLAKTATSLENEIGRKVRLEELFKSSLERLENLYEIFKHEGFSSILREWKRHASFLGCSVKITGLTEESSGVAVDVDDEGALVLRFKDGKTKRFFVGDISLQIP